MPALPLVPRQPPVAPLNPEAQQALADLQRQQKITKRLAHHLKQAADQLATAAPQLNDRGTNYHVEYSKKRRRTEANGDEEDLQARSAYEEFQTKVQDLTRTIDNRIRIVVDDQIWLDGLPEIIQRVARKAKSAAAVVQQPNPQDAGEEADELATTYPPAPAANEVPSVLVKKAAEDLAADWSAKTLTERYSQHNTYIEFYRGVYDAKNPGEDAPPIPHHSLWFANEEDTNPSYVAPGTQSKRPRRRQPPSNEATADDPNSSDLEIASEKISIKCPISFLPFTSPVTSTKCPHSFDKPAILPMFSHSQTFLPLTDAQTAELAQITNPATRARRAAELRIKTVTCPVCVIPLTVADLKPDPVLLRKVQRIQAAEARAREEAAMNDLDSDSDSDDVNGAGVGTQKRPLGLGSGLEETGAAMTEKRDGARIIKGERARSKSRGLSVVPQTQLDGEGEGHLEEEEEEDGDE
jgi:Zinc-finger of the MIZ type in Nse subunit